MCRYTLHEAFALHCRSQSASTLDGAEKFRRLQQQSLVKENINQMVAEVTGKNPCSIKIEDLNVSDMMHNHHLSKAVAHQHFYDFPQQADGQVQS